MADRQSNTHAIPVSSTTVSWSLSFKLLPNVGMKNVESCLSPEKSPKRDIKRYNFFTNGFIHEFQGLVRAVLISFLALSLVSLVN